MNIFFALICFFFGGTFIVTGWDESDLIFGSFLITAGIVLLFL